MTCEMSRKEYEDRVEFENPEITEIIPNMMLRVGKRGTSMTKWEPAISIETRYQGVLALFWPGIPEEHERIIPISLVRLAWIVEGINFMQLCHRRALYVKQPKKVVH